MSVITLQLGQCGNQMGRQLFATLHEDALGSQRGRKRSSDDEDAYRGVSLSRFFDAPRRRGKSAPSSNSVDLLRARAVLVDMESKAVHQTLAEAEKSGEWSYDATCAFAQKRGSGNNWASGYHERAPAAAETILDMVQTQAERCDQLSGFLVLMSVAGGTGSGVGSYLTERLRDRFPSSALLNAVVWPFASGEVIVQDYNAVLTTRHLQESSDGVVILQNDQLQKAASKLLLLRDISFCDLNRIISHSLAGFLQPSFDLSCFSRQRTTECSLLYHQCQLRDLHTTLSPSPDFKMLSLKSIPQMPERSQEYTRYLWPGLLKHLRQMLVCDAPIEEGMDWSVGNEPSKSLFTYGGREEERVRYAERGTNKSLANLLVVRGNELESVEKSIFDDGSLYCKWAPRELSCSVWCSRRPFNRYEKSCTLLSNSQSCVSPLDTACRKAWQMFTSRAYVHQYLQNGVSEHDLLDSFARVEQVIKSYATIN